VQLVDGEFEVGAVPDDLFDRQRASQGAADVAQLQASYSGLAGPLGDQLESAFAVREPENTRRDGGNQ
jgi:hypothetical protein